MKTQLKSSHGVNPEWVAYAIWRRGRLAHSSESRAYSRVRSYCAGGQPPAKVEKIRRCASDLGVTELDIIAILWPGCHDAQDVVDWTYRYTRDRLNGHKKSKPDYKEKYLARAADPGVKSRLAARQRALSKFQGDTAAFHSHQRATLIANMAKAMAAQGKRPPRTTEEKAQAESIAQIRSARHQLRLINRRLDAVNRALASSSKRLNKPWHLAGFPTLARWARATPDGAEYMRLRWQTKSNDRAIRAGTLPGVFTTEQWRDLMRAHDYRCAYCGRDRTEFRSKKTRTDLEMDHIFPIGHGWARNDEANIVPACKSCNASKGNCDLLEWARSAGSFVHPWAMQKYWAIHTANQESACQA